jgi:hypothetical protein
MSHSARSLRVLRYLDVTPGSATTDVVSYESGYGAHAISTFALVVRMAARGLLRRVRYGGHHRLYVTALGRRVIRAPGMSAAEARVARLAARMAAKAAR